jgi:hypothetical protein
LVFEHRKGRNMSFVDTLKGIFGTKKGKPAPKAKKATPKKAAPKKAAPKKAAPAKAPVSKK